MLLVVIVIIVFLQSWRMAIVPIVAIPVSLIGTLAVLLAFGFSLNMLTLFGLVLAIGIVVDDAIVVVENVERNIASGMSPNLAAHRTMDEVGTAVIGISLVLIAVFVPTAFIPGISGQFYLQFAITIAVSTAISAFNSLTLSPALAALLFKPHHDAVAPPRFFLARFGRTLADGFNRGFDRLAHFYAGIVRFLVGSWIALVATLAVFAGLIFATVYMAQSVPRGFIPTLDQGYAIVVIQLPDGASLSRTDAVVKQASEIINSTPGVTNAVAFAGFSGATFTNASNAGVIFAAFDPFEERLEAGESQQQVIGDLFGRLQSIREAFIIALPPPPIRGVGNAGGFKIQLQERNSADVRQILQLAYEIAGKANQTPGLTGVFTTFSASSPQFFLEIDRDKARILNVPIPNIFETLSINLGTAYVNDFNAFGRVYQVRAQADQQFRLDRDDILKLKVRSATGALVPLGTLIEIRDVTGPALVQRYNMYVSVPLQGNAAPGVSTGQALGLMEGIAAQTLPVGTSFEWTELALQERSTGNAAIFIFGLSVLFVFLALAAQYESWILPFAIVLIVPLGVLAALLGVSLRGLDNNILVQIGLIVLIGLAAKNAILIVEFARQAQERGLSAAEAAIEACRLRLRPILMTAFAFILGVVPLMIATGPGAEMRQSLGTAVFSGMLGVTLVGLFLTPVFYVTLRTLFPVRQTTIPAAADGDACRIATVGRGRRLQRAAPTRTNGAQLAGSAWRPPLSISASIARRSASARSIGRIGCGSGDRAGGEAHGGVGIDRPVRDHQRPRAGVEEGARQPGKRLAAAVARRRVAGRKDHPVGVELERRHFRCRQQAVVGFIRLVRRRQHDRRLGKAGQIARDETMRRKVQDAHARQPRLSGQKLDLRFGRIGAEAQRLLAGAERGGGGADFVRGFRQRLEAPHRRDIRRGAAEEARRVRQRRRRRPPASRPPPPACSRCARRPAGRRRNGRSAADWQSRNRARGRR